MHNNPIRYSDPTGHNKDGKDDNVDATWQTEESRNAFAQSDLSSIQASQNLPIGESPEIYTSEGDGIVVGDLFAQTDWLDFAQFAKDKGYDVTKEGLYALYKLDAGISNGTIHNNLTEFGLFVAMRDSGMLNFSSDFAVKGDIDGRVVLTESVVKNLYESVIVNSGNNLAESLDYFNINDKISFSIEIDKEVWAGKLNKDLATALTGSRFANIEMLLKSWWGEVSSHYDSFDKGSFQYLSEISSVIYLDKGGYFIKNVFLSKPGFTPDTGMGDENAVSIFHTHRGSQFFSDEDKNAADRYHKDVYMIFADGFAMKYLHDSRVKFNLFRPSTWGKGDGIENAVNY